MKSGTRDKVEGSLHQAKGKIKEVAGKITDNPELEAEGKAEKIAGKIQGKVGDVKKVLEE
ncbi:MAG: CsbD family protein [Deltaproteobacteria bacterium]|nr:MAG: CsbD family protein [Deltaproteobacteria bacterium]